MKIQAKVVNQFREKEHDNHVYEPGDIYPAEGFTADLERVTFLTEVHPELKTIFLADVQEVENTNDNEFPKHSGGGYYELSNGEKIKGKEEALAAEEKLKSGE